MSSLVRYRSDEGVVIAFVKPGRKLLSMVAMDAAGLRVRKVPLSDERYISPLDYPVAKARRRFLAAGKRFGISKGAKALIKEVA